MATRLSVAVVTSTCGLQFKQTALILSAVNNTGCTASHVWASEQNHSHTLCFLLAEKNGGVLLISALYASPSRRCLHFDVVRWLEWSNDPESYAGGRVATGRASLAGQVKGDDPD